MKTILLIPTHPAPEDPEWIQKGHSGRKMDSIEAEQWFKYKYDQDWKKWKTDTETVTGVPGNGQISETIL